jgi:Spy/CpxP family protein refolding chaperone
MSKTNWIALGLAAALAVGAAASADAGDGLRDGNRRGRRALVRARMRHAAQHRRAASIAFLASADVTNEQRALVLEKARAAAPILAESRRQARTIVAEAWVAAGAQGAQSDRAAVRAAVREKLKTLRAETKGRIDVLAKEVVASLTPEQRQKLEARAAKRGRTLDDARLTRFAAALIRRPMTVAYLEARQGK